MKKIIVGLLLLGSMNVESGFATDRIFQIDPVHSSLQFRIRHLYTQFVGRFDKLEGTISGDPANPTTMKVSASVDVNSVDTANATREKHLRSPDFFDTEHYPMATFQSLKTTQNGTNYDGTVTGKLTIMGISKEIIFQGQFLGSGVAPQGPNRAGFHATTTINRFDFGVAYSGALPSGLSMLGSNVDLIIDLEAVEVNASGGQTEEKPASHK